MGVKQALRSIDAFPRAEDHLLQKTQSGAVGNGFFFSIRSSRYFRIPLCVFEYVNILNLLLL
jgi:hypothetical protein